jgi:hypothetical protein
METIHIANCPFEKEEKKIELWLKSHGYYEVKINHDHTLRADGKMRKMVVGIRNMENIFENTQVIIDLGIQQHREPWIAIIDEDEVFWKSLSKK